MKLLDKVGDALLAKLVPGMDAVAGCGRCKPVRRQPCVCCGNRNPGVKYTFYDDCGNYCYYTCVNYCLGEPLCW